MARINNGTAVQPVQLHVPVQLHKLVKVHAQLQGVTERSVYETLLLNALRKELKQSAS